MRIVAAISEHGAVGVHRSREGVAGGLQVGRLLLRARPEVNGFLASFEFQRRVAAGDDEGVAVFAGALFGTNGLLVAAAGGFALAPANVHQKILRRANAEIPFVRWNAAGGEGTAGGKELRTPAFGGEKEGVGGKRESALAWDGSLVVKGELERVRDRDRSGFGKFDDDVARTIWRRCGIQ